MTNYNLDQLVSIAVHPSFSSKIYCYHVPKKRLWRKQKPAEILNTFSLHAPFVCFVTDFFDNPINNTHQIIDGDIYEKPEVVLSFTDKSTKTLYFNTREEAGNKAKFIQQRAANSIWMSL